MSRELTVPLLPCRDVEESCAFYLMLGFVRTFSQQRPTPYAVVERGDVVIHLFEMPGFEPQDSYASILIVTTDTGALYEAFAAGLRQGLGRVPVAGIPRMTRPRKKQGTTAGFSIVDPGGNWLRVTPFGETEEHERPERELQRVMENAARQGDARGDDAVAVAVLDAGLTRHPDAPVVDLVPALVYRAELDLRLGNTGRARETLNTVLDLTIGDEDAEALAEEIRAAAAMRDDLD